MIEYINFNNRVMAKLLCAEKVYMGIGNNNDEAYKDLVKRLNEDRFASYDFSLPTSAHNSSVRTRV